MSKKALYSSRSHSLATFQTQSTLLGSITTHKLASTKFIQDTVLKTEALLFKFGAKISAALTVKPFVVSVLVLSQPV